MYSKLLAFSVLIFLVGSFSAFGQDAKKDKNNKNDDPIAKINIKTVTESLVNGRVSSTPSAKSIVVQIPFQKNEPNNNNNNKNNNNNNNNNKNNKGNTSPAAQALQKQKQVIQQQNSQHLVTTWKELEIPLTEKTKFRQLQLAEAYDDKGNIKKYSADELKTLKGTDSKLPGYEIKSEDILPGHVVQVNLAKSADKDDKSPYATMVMVVGKDKSYKPANGSDKKAKAK